MAACLELIHIWYIFVCTFYFVNAIEYTRDNIFQCCRPKIHMSIGIFLWSRRTPPPRSLCWRSIGPKIQWNRPEKCLLNIVEVFPFCFVKCHVKIITMLLPLDKIFKLTFENLSRLSFCTIPSQSTRMIALGRGLDLITFKYLFHLPCYLIVIWSIYISW